MDMRRFLPILLIAFAALVLAAAAGVDGLAAELRGRSFGWVQPTSVVAGTLVALTVLGSVGAMLARYRKVTQ